MKEGERENRTTHMWRKRERDDKERRERERGKVDNTKT